MNKIKQKVTIWIAELFVQSKFAYSESQDFFYFVLCIIDS